jgi:hypothetical protein
MHMISLIAVAAAILGFLGGSIWIFTAAIGFLVLKMYPLMLVALVLTSIGLLAFKHYWRN